MEGINVPKKKRAVKRKYLALSDDVDDDEETEEQRIAREKFCKDRRKRRFRFRHLKKYDLSNVEDIGGSVRLYAQAMMPHDRDGTSQNDEEDTEALFLRQTMVPSLVSSHPHGHPMESLMQRAESYLNADSDNATKVKDLSHTAGDPMRFMKLGYSAPKTEDLPFTFRQSFTLEDGPKLVHVQCNDAYRRLIMGLNEWPSVHNGAIRLPRFNGDVPGCLVTLKQDFKHPHRQEQRYQYQNMLFDYEVHPDPSSSKLFHITVKKRVLPTMTKSVLMAGLLPPHRLPRSRYNPIMKRNRFPSALDTFHYFPFSSRYNHDLFRFNTAQNHYNDMLLSTDPLTTEFFRPSLQKSLTILDRESEFIHYRYASQLTARILLGSAGSLSPSTRRPGSLLFRLIRFLNKESAHWGRSGWIIRAAQEMACNRTLWNAIEPIVMHIVDKLPKIQSQLLRMDLDAIRSHLLTGEGVFSHSFAITTSKHLTDVCLRLRKELWGYVRFLVRRYRNLISDPSSSARSTGTNQTVDDVHQDNKAVNVEEFIEKFCPQVRKKQPYNVTFSLLFSQKASNDLETLRSNEYFELFSQVVHRWKIDFVSVQLTTASLLNELCYRRFKMMTSSEENLSLNTRLMSEIHVQILSYLDTACQIFGSHYKTIHKHVISAPLAMTVFLRLSYMSNIGIFRNECEVQSNNHSEDDDDMSHFSLKNEPAFDNSPISSTVLHFQNVAAEIVRYTDRLSAFQLPIFSDIYLTTGIAEMCSVLTSEAADILSQSWSPDDSTYRTPFDRVRLALAKMNSLGHIISDNIFTVSEESVQVSKIISAYERATETIRNCLKYNPHDIVYLSWYLAASAGSLVLASGLIPSNTIQTSHNEVDVQKKFRVRAKRNCRSENYVLIRTTVLTTFQSLLKLSGDQNTHSLYHLMVSSFLEWGEMIQLIVQRPRGYHDSFKDLRRLHASHTLYWACQNPSKDNLIRVMDLCRADEVTFEALLSVIASLVEHKPDDIKNWCYLAVALGPHRPKAKAINADEMTLCWWGKEREWWDQFFQVDPIHTQNTNSLNLLHALPQHDLKRSVKKFSFSLKKKKLGVNTSSASLYIHDDSWLIPNDLDSDDDDDFSHFSDDDSECTSKSDNGNNHLPREHAEVLRDKDSIALLSSLESSPLYQLDSHCRILCAKILVCAHLFGRKHSFISKTIRILLSKIESMENKEGKSYSSASDALKWLYDQGFFIQRYVACRSLSSVSTNVIYKSSCFDDYTFLRI